MDDKNRNFANECDNNILNQPQNGTILALKDLGEQTADEINCYINGQKRFVEFTKKEKEILQNAGLSNLSILQAQVLLAKAKKLELLYKEKTTDAEERLAFIDEILKNSKNKRFMLDGDKLIVDEQVVEKIKATQASSLNNNDGNNTQNLDVNNATKTQEIDILLKALEKLTGKTFDRSLFVDEDKKVSLPNKTGNQNESKSANEEITSDYGEKNCDKVSNNNFKGEFDEPLKQVDEDIEGKAKSSLENEDPSFSGIENFAEGYQTENEENIADHKINVLGDDENSFDNNIDKSTDKSKIGKDALNKDDLAQADFDDLLDDIMENAGAKNAKSNDEKDEAENTNNLLEEVVGDENTDTSPADDDFYATSATALGNVGGDQLEAQELVNVYALADGAIDFCNPQNAKLMYGIYMESTFEETFNVFLDVAYAYPLSLISLPDEALEALRKHNVTAIINGVSSDINTLEYLVRLGACSIVKAKNIRSKDDDKIKYYEWCKKISF